jgi:hypothetical protein
MFDSFASTSRFEFVGKWYDSLTGKDKWIETEATTTSCTWEDDEGGGGDYVVGYVYRVNGDYFSGRFRSESIVDKSMKLSVRYKPSNPKRHYLSSFYGGRAPLVLGIIALCFSIWWLILKLMSLGHY